MMHSLFFLGRYRKAMPLWQTSPSVRLALLMLLVATSANASVNSDLGNYFDHLGYSQNVTGPSAYQGQSANYYSAGSLSLKNRSSNLQLGQINLPSMDAGCGGIDIYGGGFSFINAGQFKQFAQNVGHAVVPLALKMGIQTLTPQLASLLDQLQEWSSKFNEWSKNSCEVAQSLVTAGAGMASSAITAVKTSACERKAIKNGQSAANAKDTCASNSSADPILSDAAKNDPNYSELPVSKNITWSHLQESAFFAGNQELAELVMSLSGTVVFDDHSKKTTLPSLLLHDREAIDALLKGSKAVTVYHCDTKTECLHPTTTSITVPPSKAFQPKVRVMLEALVTKYHDDEALTDKQKALLEMTSLPVLRMLTAAIESHQNPATFVDAYARVITAQMLSDYLSTLLHMELAVFADDNSSVDATNITDTIEKVQKYLRDLPKDDIAKLIAMNSLVKQQQTREHLINAEFNAVM
ncbi:conjugal transfer protein TraH [Vibrio mediterranei]